MLFVPDRNLAFLHIPKNAGQAVRKAIAAAAPISYASFAADLNVSEAEAERLMEAGVDVPGIGRVQPEHLPLPFLKSHFPQSFGVLAASHSFIFARPPRDRFLSALLQRLREYRGAGAIRADERIVAKEAEHVCQWLAGREVFCNMEYIHFSRQIDYAELEGHRIVSAVFPLERTDLAMAWVKAQTGLEIEVAHVHARREPKSWARSIQPAARLIGRRLIPHKIRQAIYPLWMNSGIFANAASRYGQVDLGTEVESFIKAYYAPDARLYAEARSIAGEPAGAGAG